METQFGNYAQVVSQNICDLSINPKTGKFNNPDIKTSGVVSIKPILVSESRIPSASFHSSMDPKTGITYGVPQAKNVDGSIRFSKQVITGNRYFNLSVPNDAIAFYIFQHAPFVLGSPCMAPGTKPIFYIEDAERESDIKLEKAETAMILSQEIFKMKESELRDWGILYGIDPMHNNPAMIKVQLLEFAKEAPTAMKERFENKERTTMNTLFKRGVRVGVVNFTLDKGYLFKNGVPMGMNETACVDKLMIDKDFAFNVESEVVLGEKNYTNKESTPKEVKKKK